jgi:uncharacterized membrane protein
MMNSGPDSRQDSFSNEKDSIRNGSSDSWKWGIFYYNPADPRVWLPKRIPAMGWTLNFAHRAAYWWLVGLMAIPMGILLTACVSEWMSRK